MTSTDPERRSAPRSPMAQIEPKDIDRGDFRPPSPSDPDPDGSEPVAEPETQPGAEPEDIDAAPGRRRFRLTAGGSGGSEGPSKRPMRAFSTAALVSSALLCSVLLRGCAGDGSPSKSTSKAIPAQEVGATTLLGEDVIARQATEPVMRIQPQRALASLTSPLTLDVRGEGCAGRSGVLSIMQVGTALRPGDPGRLVVRRRIDIDGAGRWQLAPLLVGQPPGAYEVIASCERRPRAEGFPNPEERRDIYTTTDVLELTGPFTSRSFTIGPSSLLLEGKTATLSLAGDGCRPNGSTLSRVTGSIFGNSDARGGDGSGHRADFAIDARLDGTWQASLTVPDAWARGSYGVQVSCDSGVPYATQTVRFVPASQLSAPVATAVGTPRATAAQPVKGIARFTG